MDRIRALFAAALILGACPCQGQQFSGIQGSIYGSVLNTSLQPAAGVNMPYRWAVAVAGVNVFWANNMYSFSPVRWTDSLGPEGYYIGGSAKRWGSVQSDVHLLNFLFRLPTQRSIVAGAGLNLHSRTCVDRLAYVANKDMVTVNDFLKANVFNRTGEARAVDQQWLEVYLTASTVMRDNETERLTAGATLRILKGITAAVADLQSISVGRSKSDPRVLVFTSGGGRYGYSKNLDDLNADNSDNGFGSTMHTLMNGSGISPGLDLGFTYTRKKQNVVAGFTDDDPSDYLWKLEASLTGLGSISYDLGSQSLSLEEVQTQPNVDRFANIFNSFSSLQDFNDSLASLISAQAWKGKFKVSLPTTLRVNYDRNLGRGLYLNAGLALNMSFLDFGADYKIREPGYLQLTPGWEITRVGVYAPLYLNTHGMVMAGAAVRLGPLLLGVHDFGWIFHPRAKGGLYAALVIKGLSGKKAECPTY